MKTKQLRCKIKVANKYEVLINRFEYIKLYCSEKNEDMKTFRDVLVWQKVMCFVIEICKVSRIFPKEETFGLTE